MEMRGEMSEGESHSDVMPQEWLVRVDGDLFMRLRFGECVV
jgi:hypothetical protein